MGSYAYDYLNDSILLDASLVVRMYEGIPTTVLEDELYKYREYCLKVLPEIRKTVKAKRETVSCMATDTMSHISRLKQAALYLEEVVVADPVFKLTNFRTDFSDVLTSFMGMVSAAKINRQELAKAANQLMELRPLVAGGYVKLYPSSFELEREAEIPLLYSDVGFEDCLPKSILEQYKLNAVVRSVQNADGRMLVMRDLYPCRNISIHFQGMEGGFAMGYLLNPTEVEATDKKDVYTFIQKKSSIPPSEGDFAAWVKQSVNQTARNHFIDLNKRIALCDDLGCMFGTEHPFESDLLNMNIGIHDIKSNTLNCAMQMDVPFLNQVSSADLMSIRNDDCEAFQSFRTALEKGLRDARHESDPDRIRAIIEDTQHELFEVQMHQIAPQVKYIKRTYLTEAIIALAGLGFSVSTSGASLIATGLAGLNVLKSNSDYKAKMAANPCHFLWKVKQQAKG